MKRLLWTAAGLAAVGLVVGCSDGRRKVVWTKVHGAVTFEGKSVAEGFVRFKDAKTGEAPEAALRPDGTYEATIPAASYTVSVMPVLVKAKDDGGLTYEKYKDAADIPLRYRDPAKSGFTAEVGESTGFDFAMTR